METLKNKLFVKITYAVVSSEEMKERNTVIILFRDLFQISAPFRISDCFKRVFTNNHHYSNILILSAVRVRKEGPSSLIAHVCYVALQNEWSSSEFLNYLNMSRSTVCLEKRRPPLRCQKETSAPGAKWVLCYGWVTNFRRSLVLVC